MSRVWKSEPGQAGLESARLSAVNAHLRQLADRVAAVAPDLDMIRALIDEYSRVDDSTCESGASATGLRIGHIPCEWLLARNSVPSSRMMYVHGGSWMSGSLQGYRAHAGRLAQETGCCVLNVDYRLAPENAFPVGLEDCDRALDWMLSNGPAGAGVPESTFIAGDSAGGNLILALLLMRRDQGKPLPNAAMALSPATDLTWGSPSITNRADIDPILRPHRLGAVVQAYVQNRAAVDDPYVSPLFGELRGLPPLMLQVGEAEVLFDDSTRFADKAGAVGVAVNLETWPDMPHVFQMFAPFLPQASGALASIGEFVHRIRKK
jgi:acetyl esterase/lipase